MKNIQWILITTMIMISCVTSGCGFFSKDEHETELAQIEAVYDEGSPVPAIGFSESQAITLAVQQSVGGKSSFVKVNDGDYMAPGKYTLGITVTPRTVNGETIAERVFVSDGGWKDLGYSAEATYDQAKKMYVADFKLLGADYYLITPILVQVIYSDGKASKAKFLVTTAKDLATPYGRLVDRGMSVTLSKAFLGTLPAIVNPMLAQQMGSSAIKIDDIYPANNGAGKYKDGVVGIDVAGIKCEIILNDTNAGGTTRGLYIGVEDISGGTMNSSLAVLTNVFANLFLRGLKIENIPTMALALGLGDLVNTMTSAPGGLAIPGLSLPPVDLGVSLDSTMYLDIKGLPAETNSDFAVLGGSLYVPDNAEVSKDSNGYYVWPTVTADTYDTMIDVGMGNIKNSATDIGVAISQYNINQMLQGLMKNLSVTVKDINKVAALFAPKVATDKLDLTVAINPKGIGVDFTNRRVVVNDVKLLMVESGAVNGPVAELSLDITMGFNVAFRMDGDKLIMDVSVTPMEDRCHMHVMKDETGLDALDHGKFVPIIFQYLAGGKSTLTIPLPLSDFGIMPRSGVAPGKMVTDEYGNCFLAMATAGIDMTKLSSGGAGCFINTAGIK